MPSPVKKKCVKCGKVLPLDNFYRLKRGSAIDPDGVLDTCKRCCTLNYQSNNPHTFMNILYALNIPWIPSYYKNMCEKKLTPANKNNPAVLGLYIASMKLTGMGEYGFFDSDNLQKQRCPECLDSIEQYDYKLPLGETTLETKTTFTLNDIVYSPQNDIRARILLQNQRAKEARAQKLNPTSVLEGPVGDDFYQGSAQVESDVIYHPTYQDPAASGSAAEVSGPPSTDPQVNPEMASSIDDLLDRSGRPNLTREEMNYLLFKWGSSYSLEQLLRLEKMYVEMMESYDVRTPNHKDSVKKLCTLSLRIDECIAAQDFQAGKAANDMYDKLSKAANLQPIQNVAADSEYLDAAGVLVKMVEAEGFIPKYVLDDSVPKDIVDITIKDSHLYLRRLVDNDGTILNRFEQEAEAYFKLQQENEEDTDEAYAMLMDIENLEKESRRFETIAADEGES